MASLVQIPWQPHLWLTPSTLALLKRASGYYGSDLYLYDNEWRRISPAWRSYAQQSEAYRRWLARTGPVASDPDSGQRNHMRGAAFDLRLTTARAQAACRLAGLIRDSEEKWHWNDPNWRNMPIIPTNTSAAGGNASLITEAKEEEEDDMTVRGIAWYKCPDKDATSWLFPDNINADGSLHWRIINESSSGNGQKEASGVQVALGYGPGLVTRDKFNKLATARRATQE